MGVEDGKGEVVACPNRRLRTRNGCSILARIIVMMRLARASKGCSLPPFGALRMTTPSLARPRERGLAPGADTALVSPDRSFLATQNHVTDRAVVQLCGRCLQAVGHAAVRVHPTDHSLPFFVDDIWGSRAPDLFLVKDGALMIVASTSVPERSVMPLSDVNLHDQMAGRYDASCRDFRASFV